jgi:tetratricopeptide (TPR) repeat protein
LRIVTVNNNIASIYFNKPDSSDKAKALNYLMTALSLNEAIGNKQAFGIVSENIGEIYLEMNQLDKAQSFFERAIQALGDTLANSAVAYNGIGKIYLKKGDYEPGTKLS